MKGLKNFLLSKFDSELQTTYINLLVWIIVAIVSGVLGASTVNLFVLIVKKIYSIIFTINLPIFIWPVIGVIFIGTVIYKLFPNSFYESVPAYIKGMRLDNGKFNIKSTIGQFLSTSIAISTLNSGGLVGPLARVNAGILSWLYSLFQKVFIGTSIDRFGRIVSICGFASAVGAIFGSSIGAGIMAVEVIEKKRMGYQDLFPAILSSASSVYFSKIFGWNLFYQYNIPNSFINLEKAFWLIAIAISASIVGMIYIKAYAKLSKWSNRNDQKTMIFKMIVGALLSALLAYFINPQVLGTSSNFISSLIGNNFDIIVGNLNPSMPLVWVLIIIMLLKAFTNIVTLGTGTNVGIVGPIAILGIFLGSIWVEILDVPIGSATYYSFLIAGFCGMITSILNIPLAAAIMAVEIFGIQYSFTAGLVTVIAFQLTRSHTIYDVIEQRLLEMEAQYQRNQKQKLDPI